MTFVIADRTLERIFGGSRAAVLQVLLNVNVGLSARQIASLANLSPSVGASALQALHKIKLVEKQEMGNAHIYTLDRQNEAVPVLNELINRLTLSNQEFYAELVNEFFADKPIDAIILYGSVARGDDRLNSDIDVLIVAERVDIEEWAPAIENAERAMARRVSRPVHITVSEWPSKTEQKNAFWRNIRDEGLSLGNLPKAAKLVRG